MIPPLPRFVSYLRVSTDSHGRSGLGLDGPAVEETGLSAWTLADLCDQRYTWAHLFAAVQPNR